MPRKMGLVTAVPHGFELWMQGKAQSAIHTVSLTLEMPKNPFQRKVTHVAWVTKETTRGPTTKLITLPTEQTARSKSSSTGHSPIKAAGCSHPPLDETQPAFDESDMDFEEMRPLRLPHKKVYFLHFLLCLWLTLSTTHLKTCNDYIREWLEHKDEFLQTLLALEAPPEPRECSMCGGDGIYRCSDCFGNFLFCTPCARQQHRGNPFHRIQQWTGEFFEDSALHLAGFELHLGHEGRSCLNGAPDFAAPRSKANPIEDESWEDIDGIPAHLHPPAHSNYITVVDVTGIHFLTFNFCTCKDAPPVYLQILNSRLFPATLQQLRTVFTFNVLDDFIRDNLECGTSGLNYFSKLRRITSNVFPHNVPVARQWRLLKLLKWKGFGHESSAPKQGELVLFCPTCQSIRGEANPGCYGESWKYTRTFIMDGNFKAEHLQERRPDDQIWLMDGLGYTVTWPTYKAYLKCTHHPEKVTEIAIAEESWRRWESGKQQVNMNYSLTHAMQHNMDQITRAITFYNINCSYMKKLRARVAGNQFIQLSPELEITPGIGIWHVHGHRAECFARYAPLFIPGSGWVDGEIIETLWSMLNIVSGSTRGMSSPHRQELLDFQMNDSNFMKMIQMTQTLTRKLKVAKQSSAAATASFTDLDSTVPEEQRQIWKDQEEQALAEQLTNPSAMDIFDLQLKKCDHVLPSIHASLTNVGKAPTIHAIQLEMLRSEAQIGAPHKGSTTWLARRLKIQETQISLSRDLRKVGIHTTEVQKLALACRAERLASDISTFLSEASAQFSDDYQDEMPANSSDEEGDEGDEELLDKLGGERPDQAKLPLPSMLGQSKCKQLGPEALIEQELRLRTGQANDALHEILMALAKKAVLFRTDVRHASSYAKTTRAWGRVNVVDAVLHRHAAIYKASRKAMVKLGADALMLNRYQALREEDLKVNTAAAAAPNTRGLCNESLSWFWMMDIPRDTEASDWMSESKAMRDRWEEEVGLLEQEFIWTINFFRHCSDEWYTRAVRSKREGLLGPACYASRQQAMYLRLREQCQVAWQRLQRPVEPHAESSPVL
ncbi:hypothetical protein OG21DRAFT_1527140 [Imleria badia]|nr:hypothetical protein OG21DRAFT_1527140 [Imleria badia]